MKLRYVSNEVNISSIDKNKFNLIIAGCGTGKTYFAANKLRQQINEIFGEDIKPYECRIVTSRKLARDQQIESYEESTSELHDIQTISLSIEDEDYRELFIDSGFGTVKEKKEKYTNRIPIITYNKFEKETDDLICKNIKLVVFDEAHTILSDVSFNETLPFTKKFIENKLNNNSSTYIVAMTATDYELDEDSINVKFNYLLDKPIFNYKITDKIISIPELKDVIKVLKKINGTTLVMTNSVKRVMELKKKLGDEAAVLIANSKKNKEFYTKEMSDLSEYIEKNKSLPQEIKYFIATSCAREGFEFEYTESFKIDNVIIYNGTVVDIIQFVGRFRGNIKRLYLAYDRRYKLINKPYKQIEQYNLCKNFVHRRNRDGSMMSKEIYLELIKHLKNIISENISIEEYSNKSVKLNNEDEFIRWIEKNWIYRTICNYQKDIIVNKAKELWLKKKNSKPHTFNSIVNQIILKNDFELILDGKLRTVNSNNEKVQKYLKKGDKIPSGNIRVYIIGKKNIFGNFI